MTDHLPSGQPTSFVGMSDADIAHHFTRVHPGGAMDELHRDRRLRSRAVTPKRDRPARSTAGVSPCCCWAATMLPGTVYGTRTACSTSPRPRQNPAAIKAARDADLRNEGCPVGDGYAVPAYFVGTDDLLAIAGVTPLHDPLAAARAADPDRAARGRGQPRRGARRADRPL